MPRITAIVHSSHGDITIDGRTGHIIGIELDGHDYESCAHINSITRFDLSEFQNFYPGEHVTEHYDILDLGYWYGDGEVYEEPDYEWRKLVREELTMREPNKPKPDLKTAAKAFLDAVSSIDFSDLPGTYDRLPFADLEAALRD